MMTTAEGWVSQATAAPTRWATRQETGQHKNGRKAAVKPNGLTMGGHLADDVNPPAILISAAPTRGDVPRRVAMHARAHAAATAASSARHPPSAGCPGAAAAAAATLGSAPVNAVAGAGRAGGGRRLHWGRRRERAGIGLWRWWRWWRQGLARRSGKNGEDIYWCHRSIESFLLQRGSTLGKRDLSVCMVARFEFSRSWQSGCFQKGVGKSCCSRRRRGDAAAWQRWRGRRSGSGEDAAMPWWRGWRGRGAAAQQLSHACAASAIAAAAAAAAGGVLPSSARRRRAKQVAVRAAAHSPPSTSGPMRLVLYLRMQEAHVARGHLYSNSASTGMTPNATPTPMRPSRTVTSSYPFWRQIAPSRRSWLKK